MPNTQNGQPKKAQPMQFAATQLIEDGLGRLMNLIQLGAEAMTSGGRAVKLPPGLVGNAQNTAQGNYDMRPYKKPAAEKSQKKPAPKKTAKQEQANKSAASMIEALSAIAPTSNPTNPDPYRTPMPVEQAEQYRRMMDNVMQSYIPSNQQAALPDSMEFYPPYDQVTGQLNPGPGYQGIMGEQPTYFIPGGMNYPMTPEAMALTQADPAYANEYAQVAQQYSEPWNAGAMMQAGIPQRVANTSPYMPDQFGQDYYEAINRLPYGVYTPVVDQLGNRAEYDPGANYFFGVPSLPPSLLNEMRSSFQPESNKRKK